ncbi:MAG: circadian clock protein KaiC [Ignavibacteriales bacterium]|nr:circadian clock protein KaiC [Ignavibacteriales bacterium]MCF8306856.1 circadian clock protein KaiC [Ignavibacteriales bacterium]MCF8316846.1 circadian clock protein KaiC [Ignavibacteriales bacterium]MCF8438115.1 circadian clock protein KaiC [Ignavibacteriales bacterium]
MSVSEIFQVNKLVTGIPGFDHISQGGLPMNRTTLLSGTAGSAKTVFASQFLAEGIIRFSQPGVFVTFEESVADIRANMSGFGWDISQWEKDQKWLFVDAAPQPSESLLIIGEYDLGALLARIENAVKKSGAKRLVMDSLGAIFTQLTDTAIIRRELFRIAYALKKMGITALMTSERIEEYGDIARYGVEEFVADNVIILRNILEEEKRRRTIEILKFRGTNHKKGEYPFTISDTGIIAIPLSAIELKQHSSDIRITSGSEELDKICSGGFFRDSVILVSGATGTGKTLMATEFMKGGVTNDERSLLFAFEESREQLFRNASGWGIDFEKFERNGKLKVVCEYPEVAGLDDHLIMMKRIIEEFKPNRVAIDSLSALERISTIKGFREFIIALTSFIKHQEIAGLFTATTSSLMGGSSITEGHISTITDSIILLRYVELLGEMKRGITVLKMRGSKHDKDIRELTIDYAGMHIGKPFRDVAGILTGNPHQIFHSDIDRLDNMFNNG